MKSSKFLLNDRFSAIYDELKASKKVENKKDLSQKLGISASTISEILSERQGLTVEFIQNFCSVFSEYTPNDFFSYSPEKNLTMVKEDAAIYKNDSNCILCTEKDQIIKIQNKLISSLERELDKWECSKPLEGDKKNIG